MFRIKICGIRKPSDIEAAHLHGADAVGFNFYPPSPRYLDPNEVATKNLAKLAHSKGIKVVGVFVDMPIESMAKIVTKLKLDAIQLHGGENVESLPLIRDRISVPIIRAIKLPQMPMDANQIDMAVLPWTAAGCLPLLDCDGGAAHGGVGRRLDWNSIGKWAAPHHQSAWVLAGGISPDSVRDAVRVAGARRVDAASGCESSKGVKSAALVRELCENFHDEMPAETDSIPALATAN